MMDERERGLERVVSYVGDLPQTLGDSFWCHHAAPERPLKDAKDPRLAALVRIANQAAREDLAEPNAAPGPSCADTEAWEVLASPNTPANPAARRELLARFAAEMRESGDPEFLPA